VIQRESRKKLMRPYLKKKLGLVVHIYNPSYLRSGGRTIMVQDQPRQNHETLSKK
jgi:hypothetical protein